MTTTDPDEQDLMIHKNFLDIRFQENLEYIHDWHATLLLGLLKDMIPLGRVTMGYLDYWRAYYQVPE